MRSVQPFILTLLFLVVTVGCGDKSGETLTGSADNASEPATSETTSTTDSAPAPEATVRRPETGLQPHPNYPVPDASPEQWLQIINQLAVQEPRGTTPDEKVEDQAGRAQSRLYAADRIILSENVDPPLMEAAVRAKLDALRLLCMIDPEGPLGSAFSEFVSALKKAETPTFAMLARVSQFENEIDRLGYGLESNPENLLSQLEEILAQKDAGMSEFLVTQYAGVVLEGCGMTEEATNVLKTIGKRFADSDDAELAKEAKVLLEKTDFRVKVLAALQGDSQKVRALFFGIREMLSDKDKLGVETLDTVMNAGQMLEYSGKFDEAKLVFKAVKAAFAKASDKDLAKQATVSVEKAQKRLGVIGEEIDIEGVHVDGTPFSWSKHKGKVVLVDFWATWSLPWRNELPNIKAAYDRFHDEGFEVVGVNLDNEQNEVYSYLREQRLPWPLIIDETSAGLYGNANAIRYGVEAVPFVMLVGRDGKVADIHVRGSDLSQRVEELLNRPSSKNASDLKDAKTRR